MPNQNQNDYGNSEDDKFATPLSEISKKSPHWGAVLVSSVRAAVAVMLFGAHRPY